MAERGFVVAALIAIITIGIPGVSGAETYISGFVETIQAQRIQINRALDAGERFIDWRSPRSELRAQLKLSGGGDRDDRSA